MPIPQAEEVVRRLPDVSACRIQTDAAGLPLMVHVTARPGRDAARIAEDVVTVLAAEAGIDVPPERVRVAFLEEATAEDREEPVALEALELETRARLVAWNVTTTEERTAAEVELALGDQSALGRAEVRGAVATPDLAAQACLDALEKLCAARVVLRLRAWHQVRIGTADVLCLVVQEIEGRNEHLRVGAARIEGDPWRAAAYAALDSMNRRMGRILAGEPRQYDIS